MGSGMDARRAARRTLDRPGFGLTKTGHELLVGVPEVLGPGGERLSIREVGALISAQTGAAKVETLARLPQRVRLAEIVDSFASADDEVFNIPFAIGESALQPMALPPAGTQPAGGGPSRLRQDHSSGGRRRGDCCQVVPEQAQITIIDPKTALIGRCRGPRFGPTRTPPRILTHR